MRVYLFRAALAAACFALLAMIVLPAPVARRSHRRSSTFLPAPKKAKKAGGRHHAAGKYHGRGRLQSRAPLHRAPKHPGKLGRP